MSKLQKFAEAAAAPRPNLRDVDALIYETPIKAPDAGRQVAKPIPIADIWPDRRQPRKLPSAARAGWNGDPAAIQPVFERWFALAEQESGHPVNLLPRLEATEDVKPDQSLGPIESSLLALIDLASSIRRDGLNNPISILRHGDTYQIETGERRWLAHHLLLLTYQDSGEDSWARILAHVVEKSSIWRQAAENGARENLNAIGKARQLALLLIDIYSQEGIPFADIDELVKPGECDRAYYAQVADGEVYRVPRGMSQPILSVMGLPDPGQIRKYRALLRANDALWTRADDENLDEFTIRGLMEQSRHTVPHGTVPKPKTKPKPVTLKLSAESLAATKWGEVKARMPETPDDELLADIFDFYLKHQE